MFCGMLNYYIFALFEHLNKIINNFNSENFSILLIFIVLKLDIFIVYYYLNNECE